MTQELESHKRSKKYYILRHTIQYEHIKKRVNYVDVYLFFRKMCGTALQASSNHYRHNLGGGGYRPGGIHSMETDDSDGLDVVGLDDHHRPHHDSHPRFGTGKFNF